jgi:hypothetical protein
MRESTDCAAEPLDRWADAVGRLQKAADIGMGSASTHNDAFATATSHLAVAHLRGLGVPEDAMSGRRWLHQATEALDASAIYNQVILYLLSRYGHETSFECMDDKSGIGDFGDCQWLPTAGFVPISFQFKKTAQ